MTDQKKAAPITAELSSTTVMHIEIGLALLRSLMPDEAEIEQSEIEWIEVMNQLGVDTEEVRRTNAKYAGTLASIVKLGAAAHQFNLAKK